MKRRGKLICISGRSGSGKDTAGAYLTQRHGFVRVAFADHLKWAVMTIFALSHDQLWGSARDVPDPGLGVAPREIYQRFGDMCREFDPQVWIRPWHARTEVLLASGTNVVCTDLRTTDELALARTLGATLWRISREGAGAPGDMGRHHTETALDGNELDQLILNNGTVERLHQRIDEALI